MAYYRVRTGNGEIIVQHNYSMAYVGEIYKDRLVGECDEYGNLRNAYISPELEEALTNFTTDRIDVVTHEDIGLGKPDWSSINEPPKYFGGIQRDLTSEGNVVETPIKETDMTDPTGLKFGNATNIQFTVEDGVTRLVYDAGGRRHSMVYGKGEFTSMSIPLEALETLKGLKGVKFNDSTIPADVDRKSVYGSAIKDAIKHVPLNDIDRVALNIAIESITESVTCSEWDRVDWNRIVRNHSDLTVQEFIDVMNGKVEYINGYNDDPTLAQVLSVRAIVKAIEDWLNTRSKSAHEVYQATVNPEATVEEFLTAIAPRTVQFTEGGNLIEDPVAPVDTPKELRKELLGKLNQIRNVTYRSFGIEHHLSEDHIFALEKQYVIARSYVKKQLRKELLDTDNADNIYLDVAQQGTFRVLRMNDEADWTLIAGVAFKDYNWVITQ